MSTKKAIHGTGPLFESARRHPAGQTVDGKAPSLPSLEGKWTPGPWVVKGPGDRDEWEEEFPYLSVCSHWNPPKNGVVGYEVCRMSGNSNHTLPNAKLIAAAPELYAALKDLLEIIDCVDGLTKVEWRQEAEAARAALAKAAGVKPETPGETRRTA